MFKGIRDAPKRFNLPYVCINCLAKTRRVDRPARQSQNRWITRNQINNIRAAEEAWAARAAAIKNGEKQSMLSLLEQRGYVNQIVGKREDLDRLMTDRRVGAYAGFDPTAPSLHVGHMVPLMVLGWLFIHGYSVNYLLGSVTAKVGDPTDRLTAREDQGKASHTANVVSMHLQLKRLAESMERYAGRRGYAREWAWKRALVNNADWYRSLTLPEFLKVMGQGMRIGPMLGRDTVKNRMQKGDGMSFAEFTYPLMQAWDWWQLYKKGVQVQVGGADQFGNILAGAEAVKYMSKNDNAYLSELTSRQMREFQNSVATSSDPMGFTVPLLTTASGAKFGKSAGNAVWLDPDMTSSFDLYQFFLRSADADVERYLKMLTFLPLSEIRILMEGHTKDASKRVAQHKLASEFVELVHGIEAAQAAESQHRQLFRGEISVADLHETTTVAKPTEADSSRPSDISPSLNRNAAPARMETTQSLHLKLPHSLVHRQALSKILWSAGLVASRSEGQRLINNKGAHIGSKSDGTGNMDDTVSFTPITTGTSDQVEKFIIDGSLLVLRVGKWKVKIINIVPDEEYEAEGLQCPGWKEEAGDDAGRTSFKETQRKQTARKIDRPRGTSSFGPVKSAGWA